MFWAEAAATEVASVVTVMPVTSMPLTPRLKQVWRDKAQDSAELRANDSPGAPSLNTFGGGRKYDLRVPGARPPIRIFVIDFYLTQLFDIKQRRERGLRQSEHDVPRFAPVCLPTTATRVPQSWS